MSDTPFPEAILTTTESVCPECLARIPGDNVAAGEDVYLAKTCPEHGEFRTVVWRGAPDFVGWARPKAPAYPSSPSTNLDLGCPFDCGLCPDHRQQTCTALLEVTQRCDLRCSFCFASAGPDGPPDPDLATIESWYRGLLASNGPCNIQLSGGEPTMRDDLPDIVALGKSLGFEFIQVNSNGLRLARDEAYVRKLAEAGLASVFLQFDGTRDDIHRVTRGRRMLAQKIDAIEQCGAHGIGVVLVPTLVPGVNTNDIGAIIRFALDRFPYVRGVHFQPVTYLGRYPTPPSDADRITIPEVIRAIDEQTDGLITADTLTTGGCENARCSLHGNYVVMPDGSLAPWTRHQPEACCTPKSAAEGAAQTRQFVADHWSGNTEGAGTFIPLGQVGRRPLGDWDVFLERQQTHTFCVSGMAFQDAWTLDLERLRDCCIHTVAPDGRIIPFCAYNLTDSFGKALYRGATVG
ncbi:MAG: radical SAM (seleno)protein TrsS [Acidimicrobiia bacterium]